MAALLFLYSEVLVLDLPWMENVVRAKRAPRLPMALSRAETIALLRTMSGREALMDGLLSASNPMLNSGPRLSPIQAGAGVQFRRRRCSVYSAAMSGCLAFRNRTGEENRDRKAAARRLPSR